MAIKKSRNSADDFVRLLFVVAALENSRYVQENLSASFNTG